MRSAEQLLRTPEEWQEFQARERARILAELLAELDAAWRARAPWYLWVLGWRGGHGAEAIACEDPGADPGTLF